MSDGRVGIIHRAQTMHERGRTERWFPGITEIKITAQISSEFL